MSKPAARLPPAPWLDAPATRAVIAALQAGGGPDAARFVGGCVRDTLIGRVAASMDIDIATPLTPPQVMAAAAAAGLKAVPTGVEHGTVTLVAAGRQFEVTTLRRDVETDGRRAVVAFTLDWAEDAARRDFRLNALYAAPDGGVFDPSGGGIADARAGRVVFVGEPQQRIREDYLRILRFFRFWAWYGQGPLDPAGLAACAALSAGLDGLSAERVTQELRKLLAAPDPGAAVGAMHDAGVLARILPDARVEALARVVAVQTALGEAPDAVLRLTALAGREAGALARLRLSNAERDRLAGALQPIAALATLDPRAIRRQTYVAGAQAVRDRLRLTADPSHASALAPTLAQVDAWRPPRFPLGGEDIMAAGATEGPQVGRVRRAVETWWIEADFPDDPETARAVATRALLQS